MCLKVVKSIVASVTKPYSLSISSQEPEYYLGCCEAGAEEKVLSSRSFGGKSSLGLLLAKHCSPSNCMEHRLNKIDIWHCIEMENIHKSRLSIDLNSVGDNAMKYYNDQWRCYVWWHTWACLGLHRCLSETKDLILGMSRDSSLECPIVQKIDLKRARCPSVRGYRCVQKTWVVSFTPHQISPDQWALDLMIKSDLVKDLSLPGCFAQIRSQRWIVTFHRWTNAMQCNG